MVNDYRTDMRPSHWGLNFNTMGTKYYWDRHVGGFSVFLAIVGLRAILKNLVEGPYLIVF